MRTGNSVAMLVGFLLIGLAVPLAAQESGLGARSGVAGGGLRGLDGADARPGAAVGPTFALRINRWLAVQTELLYTSYGAWLTDAIALQASSPFSLAQFRYLQLPILARLDLGRLLELDAPVQALLNAGPHASARLTCRLDPVSAAEESIPCGAAPDVSPFARMNTFEMGAMSGAAVAIELFRLFQVAADVRYQHGFSRYGPLDTGFRQGMWTFALRLSGTDDAVAPAGFADTPVPPVLQGGTLLPAPTRPVKGVEK